MRRRDFITLAGAAALLAPRDVLAQARVPRIAYLSIAQLAAWNESFKQGLADHGYVDGKSVAVEFFVAPSSNELAAVAAMVVASRPDLIATSGSAAALAAKAATATIPVVFTNVSDPLSIGLIPSLARPGGNITGNTILAAEMVGKQLQVLKDIVPGLNRIVVFNVPADPAAAPILAQVRAAASALALDAVVVDFAIGQEISVQFQRVLDARAQAAYVPASTYLSADRDALFDLLVRAKLPAVSFGPTLGATRPTIGVIGYGPSITGEIRRSAALVDAILKGAKPGDLTVQQPTIFELTLNLAAARAIGLPIPAAIFAQATMVIE